VPVFVYKKTMNGFGEFMAETELQASFHQKNQLCVRPGSPAETQQSLRLMPMTATAIFTG
jgi:hypothetical protein